MNGCVCLGGNMSILGNILSTWGQGGSGVVFSTSGFSA